MGAGSPRSWRRDLSVLLTRVPGVQTPAQSLAHTKGLQERRKRMWKVQTRSQARESSPEILVQERLQVRGGQGGLQLSQDAKR